MKKYQVVFRDLEKKINQSDYPADSFLPSEGELAGKYGVSRDTIRKALSLLEKAKLIRKSQGRASLVRRQQHFNFPVSNLTSYQELVQNLQMNSETKVLSLYRLLVDGDLARVTGFQPGQQVWRIQRQRIVDGASSVLDTDYLLTDFVKRINQTIAQRSIYNYLEGELGLEIAYAQKEITIEPTSEQDKIWLDVGLEHHVVSVKSKVYLADQAQFQFTESRHILEKFHFIDYARRKK
ncbi:trehalose operon repressor [Streptococcus sobrinus]|uniref:trehalose operon repressor n=1 Tax=Streptococcus sobrinus TaxID=1310 RepID=UPI00030FA619|nr:trehalose operon repressor [Streptococcus sobrinus]